METGERKTGVSGLLATLSVLPPAQEDEPEVEDTGLSGSLTPGTVGPSESPTLALLRPTSVPARP